MDNEVATKKKYRVRLQTRNSERVFENVPARNVAAAVKRVLNGDAKHIACDVGQTFDVAVTRLA